MSKQLLSKLEDDLLKDIKYMFYVPLDNKKVIVTIYYKSGGKDTYEMTKNNYKMILDKVKEVNDNDKGNN